jgi:hypothetical protein
VLAAAAGAPRAFSAGGSAGSRQQQVLVSAERICAASLLQLCCGRLIWLEVLVCVCLCTAKQVVPTLAAAACQPTSGAASCEPAVYTLSLKPVAADVGLMHAGLSQPSLQQLVRESSSDVQEI